MNKATHYTVLDEWEEGDSFYFYLIKPNDLVKDADGTPKPDESPGIWIRITPENQQGHLAIVTRDQRND